MPAQICSQGMGRAIVSGGADTVRARKQAGQCANRQDFRERSAGDAILLRFIRGWRIKLLESQAFVGTLETVE